MRDIDYLVPQFMLDDEDFKVYIDLFNFVYRRSKTNIQSMDDMITIDSIPDSFLKYIASLYDFELRDTVPNDKHRQALHNIFNINQNRGTELDIAYAGSYGDFDGWISGDIFYPGLYEDRPLSIVTKPMSKVFIWNRSTWSSSYRFVSATWRDGIIYVTVPAINDAIKAAVNKVVPAGIKVNFQLNPTLSPEAVGIIKYPYDIYDVGYPETTEFVDNLYLHLTFELGPVYYYQYLSFEEQAYVPPARYSLNFKYSGRPVLSGYQILDEDNPSRDSSPLLVYPSIHFIYNKLVKLERYPIAGSPFYSLGFGEFSPGNNQFAFQAPAEILFSSDTEAWDNAQPIFSTYTSFSDYTKSISLCSSQIYLDDIYDIDLLIDSSDDGNLVSFGKEYNAQASAEILLVEV